MPLDALLSPCSPGRSSAADAPTSAFPRDTPSGHATSRIGLDALPEEPLRQVVDHLRNPDVLAFGMASKYCFKIAHTRREAVLTQDSIRWIVTPSGCDKAVSRINACAAPLRPRLVRALMRQIWTLHPSLQPHATLGLQRLLPPPSPEAQLRDRLDHYENGMTRGHPPGTPTLGPPPLASILALPWQRQGKLLQRWLDLGPGAAPDYLSLQAWQATAASLPPPHGIDVLTAVVATACDDDDGWAALMTHAQDTALSMLDDDPTVPASPPCTRLLVALAHALRTPSFRDEEGSTVRTAMWDRLLDLAGRLPPHARIGLLKELAEYLSLAAYARYRTAGLVERCERLIAAAFRHLPPADTAVLLGAIAADPYRDENDVRLARIPLLTTVMLAANQLPAEGYADVLVAVLAGAASYWESQEHMLIWEAIAATSILAPPAARARMLAALAAAIAWTVPQDQDDDEAGATRWSAMAQRIAHLPASARGEALVALCASMPCIHGEPKPVALLLQLSSGTPASYRAELLARLIHHPNYIRNRSQWRDIMREFAALPVEARAIAARKLILALAYFRNEGRHDAADAAGEDTASPESADGSLSAWPASPADALRKLSMHFAPLTEQDRARLLVQFAGKLHRHPWHSLALDWLLRETMQLPLLSRHAPLIVTRACAFAAQSCPPEEADAVHGWLVDAIGARVPAEQREAALLYLSDLNARVGASPHRLAAIDALRDGEPQHGRQAATSQAVGGSRKRKAPSP